ncbi:hypothetical protein [Dendronalium sp. ChiSLP03b]|nr:hypothetical protein [Dendronalium sp. ChiSLP03b]
MNHDSCRKAVRSLCIKQPVMRISILNNKHQIILLCVDVTSG